MKFFFGKNRKLLTNISKYSITNVLQDHNYTFDIDNRKKIKKSFAELQLMLYLYFHCYEELNVHQFDKDNYECITSI